jgi:glycosyltransferase involved in cell wall biosynthesis
MSTSHAPASVAGRHLLLIARNFPPSGTIGARRVLRFARGLSQAGMRVTVLTTETRFYATVDPTASDGDEPFEIVRTSTWSPSVRLSGGETAPGPAAAPEAAGQADAALSLRRRLLRSARQLVGLFLRPDEDLAWVPFAVRAGMAVHARHPVDIVMTSMPPYSSLVAASRIARRCGATLVADYRDAWAADRENWRVGGRIQRWMEQRLERRHLRRVSLALFTSPTARAFYDEHFPYAKRTEVLFNGIDSYVEREDPLPGAPLVWMHAGHLYRGERSLAAVIHAMAELRDEVPMRLVLIGVGTERELALAESLGIGDRVEALGRLPLDQTLKRLRLAHRLLAPIAPQHAHAIPGKVFDYLSTSRPILLLCDPAHAAASVLAGLPGHHTLAPDDAAAVARLIREDHRALAEGGLQDLDRRSNRPFESEAQLEQLVAWLGEL